MYNSNPYDNCFNVYQYGTLLGRFSPYGTDIEYLSADAHLINRANIEFDYSGKKINIIPKDEWAENGWEMAWEGQSENKQRGISFISKYPPHGKTPITIKTDITGVNDLYLMESDNPGQELAVVLNNTHVADLTIEGPDLKPSLADETGTPHRTYTAVRKDNFIIIERIGGATDAKLTPLVMTSGKIALKEADSDQFIPPFSVRYPSNMKLERGDDKRHVKVNVDNEEIGTFSITERWGAEFINASWPLSNRYSITIDKQQDGSKVIITEKPEWDYFECETDGQGIGVDDKNTEFTINMSSKNRKTNIKLRVPNVIKPKVKVNKETGEIEVRNGKNEIIHKFRIKNINKNDNENDNENDVSGPEDSFSTNFITKIKDDEDPPYIQLEPPRPQIPGVN